MAIVEHIKVETGESIRTVKEMRKELKDLKDQLLNTAEGTEEYKQKMVEAANIQHQLKEQMAEINASAMDFGQKLGNVTKTMAGVSGAITAATGALSLFGIENEEAQKKITATMTSLIGITEGLAKMDDGIKAFKRLSIAVNMGSKSLGVFKTALIGTGIGALVVVLGSVIAYWDEFSAAIGLSTEKLQRLGDIAKGVINVITSGMKGIASALGKMLRGDFKGAWQELKQGFSVVDNFNQGVANSVAKREEEITRKQQEEAEKQAKIAEDAYKKRIEQVEKLAKYERDMAAAQTRGSDSDKYSQGAYDRQMKYFDALFAVYRKDSDEYKNLVLEKEQFLQDWENHFIEVAAKEEEANARKAAEAQKAAEQEALRAQEARQKLLDDFAESQLSEQQRLDARYQMLMDAAIKEGQDTYDIQKWYEEEKTKIVEEEEEKQTQIRKASLQDYATMANGIGSILGSLSDMMEEGSEEQKGLAIAATTIQMLVGIATALSGVFTTKTGPWDIALAAVQAASIAASGIASITKIKNVSKDGSGASVSMPSSVPSIDINSVMGSIPDFSQTLDGAMTQTSIKDQRVYVTEHDITETQTKVRVQQAAATY